MARNELSLRLNFKKDFLADFRMIWRGIVIPSTIEEPCFPCKISHLTPRVMIFYR
ncbi:MAG: hypothetical protein Ctma_0848 [Catillopecten margaritatus gill symbiont]|uniref:Uncharacterized protein n=1 Tax=Catillopecten margaritatus gill symbiont TaxID=3083288 RepID=A0AAU6PGK6_9GAMM